MENLDNNIIRQFISKIDVRRDDECWEWKAYKNKDGYGTFFINTSSTTLLAHRISYFIYYGYLPKYDGVNNLIMHKCDNPACCNPRHLHLGTAANNTNDMFSRGRNSPYKIALSLAKLSANVIQEIRKMRVVKSICPKRYKFPQEFIAKKFNVSIGTVVNIWKLKKYPCREGYYIHF